jgi:hypothetical protein
VPGDDHPRLRLFSEPSGLSDEGEHLLGDG